MSHFPSFLTDDQSANLTHMYQEITYQVESWRDNVDSLSRQLPELNKRAWLREARCIDLLGIGSSFNAALIASAGASIKTCPQKSTSYRPIGDICLAISQSGTSTDTLEAVEVARGKGLRLIGVTATEGSPLAQLADETILLDLPEEKAIAATGSMTGTVLALVMLLATLEGTPMPDAENLLKGLDNLLDEQRRRASALERLVEALEEAQYIAVLGEGPFEGCAMEAALKIRETAGVLAEGMSPREYRHGPTQVLTSTVLAEAGVKRAVILIEPGLANGKATRKFYNEMHAEHAETPRAFRLLTIKFGQENHPDEIALPDLGIWTPMLAIVLLGQMTAYELALRKGLEPGVSDTLSKVVVTTG